MAIYRTHGAAPELRTSMTVSCTPHYKDDVDKPWCSREGVINIALFLSPKSTMSLEDLAKMIEEFLHTIHTDSGMQVTQLTLQTNVSTKYEMNIQSMIFQGESMPRSAQMSTLQAKTFLRDQEPFSVVYELRMSTYRTTTTDIQTRGFLQSCCPCCFAQRDPNRVNVSIHSAPRGQQMNIRQ